MFYLAYKVVTKNVNVSYIMGRIYENFGCSASPEKPETLASLGPAFQCGSTGLGLSNCCPLERGQALSSLSQPPPGPKVSPP